MEAEQEQRVARKIFDAHSKRQNFQPLRGLDAPGSLDSAYRIQDKVHHLFETEGGVGPMGGHKIALTSRAVQELCGVDQPAYGGIVAKTIQRSPASVKLSDFLHLGLEFEVAVEVDRDVPASTTAYDRDSIAGYVAACMTAFELIEDRNADYSDLDAASILTDRCWCGGVVLGEPVTDWRDLDLTNAVGELSWNGETIDRGVTGDALGHPLEGLAWIANHLIGRGQILRRGDIVITGSALKTRFPQIGDEVLYSVEGLGDIAVSFEA
ncbi:2-keto-4-pentenoate hydratase [Pelagibius sp. Alg239-R121]|uniref:2-keto-4-pentenoate hydratase n=1 Tax=Pelagibius sp. Alg239-R121 TaxID=2993448 RepID=UPI0024A76D55|nr:fumarylacetoacetate hydrolase family protein [Pelagibius sp. Alg239-R121]